MKVVILAGGLGTRISEESHLRPKPMVEIGGMPLLWHIMKYYASFGYHDFIICAGYKQNVIKDFFANYHLNHSDVTFDFAKDCQMTVHSTAAEPWRVTVVDTGLYTMTGGRMKRVQRYLDDEPFFLTYGDGLSDVDLAAEVAFHRAHGRLATLLAVQPDSRFGVLDLEGDTVNAFREKSVADAALINGGFMILDKRVLPYIEGDTTVFERGPLEQLCKMRQLMAFRHGGFWQCMDTLRDKERLEVLWQSGAAPWKRWQA